MSGNKKQQITLRKRYGDDYMSIIASKGGKKSTSRPFKDPEKARAAANKRWANYRKLAK